MQRAWNCPLQEQVETADYLKVPFMGHLFTKQGLKIDPNKAKAVLEMPRPDDMEGVQRLDRFVNYLSKFLPRLADHNGAYTPPHTTRHRV